MTKLVVGLASLIAVSTVATAHADDGVSPALDLALRPPGATPQLDEVTPKSKSTAELLAIGGSVAGTTLLALTVFDGGDSSPLHRAAVPMFVTGAALAVVGPSFGNWYAHDALSTGLGLRLLGAAGTGLGLSLLAGNLFSSNTGPATAGVVIAASGLGTVALGTILDLVETPHAVDAYNHSHRLRLTVAPLVSRGAGGQQTGMTIGGTF